MRKLFAVAMVVGLMGFVGSASAAPVLSLVWQGSNTVAPGGSATLNVILNSDVVLTAATLAVRIADGSATAPSITAATFTPAPFASVQGSSDPKQVATFGGLSLDGADPGTYTFGTVTVQAGAGLGSFGIDPFQRPGIDDWFDLSGLNIVIPTLQGATLNVIPEPGTAALLGLGLVGLIAVGRRSRA
jgi:hypothetical protein